MNRIKFVDNLKGFGILCVILGHIASPFSNFIYLWHMPLFFFIGGFFININKNNIEFIKNNAKILLGAYILFGTIGIGIECIKDVLLNRELEFAKLIIGLLFYMDYEHLQNSYALILWFLPSLLFAKIFTFLILKYKKMVLIPYFVAFFLILKYDIKLPFVIDIGIIVSIFTIFGYFMFKNLKKYDKIPIWIIITILCYTFTKIDLITYRNFIWIQNIPFACSFLALLLYVFYKYSNILNFSYFGRDSMFFYITHIYTNNIANSILKHIGGWYNNYITIFALSIIILVAINTIKNKI